MWICDQCETQNQDSAGSCYICGAKRHFDEAPVKAVIAPERSAINAQNVQNPEKIEFAWDTPVAGEPRNVMPVRPAPVERSYPEVRRPYDRAYPVPDGRAEPYPTHTGKGLRTVLRASLIAANLVLLVLNLINLYGVL